MEVEIIIQLLQDVGEPLVIKMNGLIEQWSKLISTTDTQTTTHTFSVQYTQPQVCSISIYFDGNSAYVVHPRTINNSSVTLQTDRWTTTRHVSSFDFIIIGY